MRKLLLPVAGLVAFSVLLGACDAQITPSAARVDSAAIAPSTLDDAMRSIASNTGYLCEIDPQSTLATAGVGGTTYAASFAADVLTELVQYKAVHEHVARLGLPETSFARQLAAQQLPAALNPTSTSGCKTSGAGVLAAFSRSYRSRLTQFEEDELVLLAHLAGVPLTRQGVAEYESAHKGASTQSCTSVIEVSSSASALALRKQILAGASFASVAKADSLDTSSASSGGSLGCVFPSEFTSPLDTVVADLPVGQVSPPVKFASGYLLLLVTSRPLAPLQQVASAIVLGQEAKFSGLLAKTTGAAHVTVDPAYGTWADSSTGWRVEAPTGPPDALLPNPAAITPTASSASSG